VSVSQKFTSSSWIVYLLLWLIEVWLCPEACLRLDVCNITRNCVQHILHSLLSKSLVIKLHFCLSCSPCSIILVTDTLR